MFIKYVKDLLIISTDLMILYHQIVLLRSEQECLGVDLYELILREEIGDLSEIDRVHYFELLTIFFNNKNSTENQWWSFNFFLAT